MKSGVCETPNPPDSAALHPGYLATLLPCYNSRLIQMIKTENSVEVDNVAYQYDIDGLRTAKNDDGLTTHYLVDKNRDYGQVIKELDSSNTSTVDYLYGDDLIKQTRSANDAYYLYDGHGSTRALSNATGAITDTYDYNAYGQLIDSSGATDNSYLYTGEQFDATLDNYYLRARYYDPSAGRFTTMDTWLGKPNEPITLNKYLYANSDPVMYTDPTGKYSLGSLSAGMNIQAVLATTTVAAVGVSAVNFTLDSSSADVGFSGIQKNWILLAAMAGAGSSLLDLVTSKLGENSGGNVIMYHGSSVDSLVSLLNGAPLSAAVAMEQKFPGEEGTVVGFYLTPDYAAAEYFGLRRGGGVIQFEFTNAAFQAIRAGSIVQPIPPIGSSNQSPGTEMIVQPLVFPLFDSLRQSGQITATPTN